MVEPLDEKLMSNNSKLCPSPNSIMMEASPMSLGDITTADAVQWWRALHCIAREVKRFQDVHVMKRSHGSGWSTSGDNMTKLNSVHFSLKTNNQILKKLKNNVMHAIDIARQIHMSKIKETLSLKKRLCLAKRDSDVRDRILAELQSKTEALRVELGTIQSIIELAYSQLQVIRAEPVEPIPGCEKLKQIILRCGEYYASYVNEHETRMKLEQRNRFLDNKINILNSQDTSEKTFIHRKSGKADMNIVKKESNQCPPGQMCLKRHFGILGDLVKDQESLVQVLTELASELNTSMK